MASYVRDKRSPKPKNASVSRVMSSNKAKNSKPEMILRKFLWADGIRGYRLHPKGLPGRPDIAFPVAHVAVFVNGCFWHRCPHCNYDLPKHNSAFWKEKFNKNVERDKKKIMALEELGWRTITIWECEMKSNIQKQIERIKKLIYGKKKG